MCSSKAEVVISLEAEAMAQKQETRPYIQRRYTVSVSKTSGDLQLEGLKWICLWQVLGTGFLLLPAWEWELFLSPCQRQGAAES